MYRTLFHVGVCFFFNIFFHLSLKKQYNKNVRYEIFLSSMSHCFLGTRQQPPTTISEKFYSIHVKLRRVHQSKDTHVNQYSHKLITAKSVGSKQIKRRQWSSLFGNNNNGHRRHLSRKSRILTPSSRGINRRTAEWAINSPPRQIPLRVSQDMATGFTCDVAEVQES